MYNCVFVKTPTLTLTSTQHNGWVWHEKDFANPTTHHRNSMSRISQLLLTRFWWNFKGRFLWTFRTDSNCQGDICPRNICPRDICPYQEYLSCYWPDFDETLHSSSLFSVISQPMKICTNSNTNPNLCFYWKLRD